MAETGTGEECGVVGIYLPAAEWDAQQAENVSIGRLAKWAINGLQHRGPDSAGIAVNDYGVITTLRGEGAVPVALPDDAVATLPQARIAVAHARMATSKHGGQAMSMQPTFHSTTRGGISIAHNGNVINEPELARETGYVNEKRAPSDSWFMAGLIRDEVNRGAKLPEAMATVLRRTEGGLSVIATGGGALAPELIGVRGANGIRPLVLGRIGAGWMLASEAGALYDVGGTFEREVEPGEMIRISDVGVSSSFYDAPRPRSCLFEDVYFSREDQVRARDKRHRMGRRLAVESPADADAVVAVPNSGILAAEGFAEQSGIPLVEGIVKLGDKRSFTAATQLMRDLVAGSNKRVIPEFIDGKRIVIVDDSIVRGTSLVPLITKLYDAGALEVHVRISSPPVKWPCFYGVDFATRKELIAANYGIDEIRDHIRATSLGYLSLSGLIEAAAGSSSPESTSKYCGACFDGDYPTALPPRIMNQIFAGAA